jgi:26S proteasome regulatory subunit T5
MKSENTRLRHELDKAEKLTAENREKIKMQKQLPYLVSNVIEILELPPEDEDDEPESKKSVGVKTSTRQTAFLPVPGLVDPEKLKPGDLVGVNKDSFLILDTLPAEYDARV